MSSRWSETEAPRGGDYDQRWSELAEQGENIHGEADLVWSLTPGSVLDAGCGTGRVGIELARRGADVVGVDLDEAMLATAIDKAPDLTWVAADLVDVDLGRRFDVVVMAGNVMIFVSPGTEAAVVSNLAGHLEPGGHLVAGFQLRTGRLDIDAYDRHAAACGLEPVARYRTWQGDPWRPTDDYVVSVHRLTA